MSNGGTEWPGLNKFAAVQELLDRNKLLINQVNANHAARTEEALTHNKVLIKELNNNIAKVVELYRELGEAMPAEQQAAAAAAGAVADQPTQA